MKTKIKHINFIIQDVIIITPCIMKFTMNSEYIVNWNSTNLKQ